MCSSWDLEGITEPSLSLETELRWVMQISKNNSFALDSAHVKFGVWTRPHEAWSLFCRVITSRNCSRSKFQRALAVKLSHRPEVSQRVALFAVFTCVAKNARICLFVCIAFMPRPHVSVFIWKWIFLSVFKKQMVFVRPHENDKTITPLTEQAHGASFVVSRVCLP